jgi:ketosteroid isomerase-like protein
MKSITLLSLIVMIAAGPALAAAQSTPPERSADAATIRSQIEDICRAFVNKDRQRLIETHGKDWRGFTPQSDHVIRGLDGYMNEATFDPATPKGAGMIGYRLSDFDVVFYGDTAVASFLLDVDVAYGGTARTQRLTLLDVFHKEPKGWIQVASNTSLHPEELDRRVSQARPLGEAERTAVLTAREAVWRAWFGGDTAALTTLLPPELVTIGPGSDRFGSRASNLEASRGFAAAGGKLARLVFPRTEFQAYGNTVILYTTYEMDTVSDGKTKTERGAATEVFVRQGGRWLNSGWQLASQPTARHKDH